MSLVLVLGGVRSGKSELAEEMARSTGAPVVYIATSGAADPEMAERVAAHRGRRPPEWRTVETADPLPVLSEAGGATVLLDGVGGWIAALMESEGMWTDEAVAALGERGEAARRRAMARVRAFAGAAGSRPAATIAVAEEAGMGLVPSGPNGAGARRYLDLAGEAVGILAEAAEAVRLVVAGLPVELKASPAPPAAPAAGGLRLHGDSMASPGCLDFAVNVVSGGPPESLRAPLVPALDGAAEYPDERQAVAALASRHGRAASEVLPLNGSAEGLWLVAFVLRPRRPVCVHPSFTEAEAALRAAGCPVERVFRDPHDFALRPEQIPPEADFVALCNPNNPTGTLDPSAAIERLARPGRLLVVDEAFMEFCPGERESLAPRADLPGLVVLRSLTKLWSIPGLRAGYLLAPPEVVSALRAARQPWSVNALALAALAACAGDREGAPEIAGRVGRARKELALELARLPGMKVRPSVANFLLLEVADGPAVLAALARRGIALRRCDTFPGLGANHLRVAVRAPEDNRRLVEGLREILA